MPTFTLAQQFYPIGNSQDLVPKLDSFQAKTILAQYDLLVPVQALIDHPDTPVKIKLAWDNAVPFKRDNPLVLFIAQQLDISTSLLDELFTNGMLVTAESL